MCGIGGILRVWPADQRDIALRTPHDQSIPEAWLDILDDSIKHRGPDGQGRFRDRAVRADGCVVDVAFVHRRLSIIDHAGGHQPMVHLADLGRPALRAGRLLSTSEFERWNQSIIIRSSPGPEARPTQDLVAVIFNGCIYNHRELRAELQQAGHVFNTDHSDTEVLIHGARQWGDTLIDHLDGMFAAAVWTSEGKLWLMRDRHGEKPMSMRIHHANGSAYIAFASVPPYRVFDRPSVHPSGSPTQDALEQWVRFGFFCAAPGTSDAIHPGRAFPLHNCIFERENENALVSYATALSDRDYIPPVRRDRALGVDEAERLLDKAVQSRLEADVPLGTLLSGGVDSSLVTLFAKRHVPGLRSFCVRMPSAQYDESAHAAAVAKIIGTEHTTLECDAKPAEDLVRLIQQVGLPFGDSSLLPAYWVCRAARQHVKVALSGDGGDELFAGYERYKAFKWMATTSYLLPLVWAGSWLSPGPDVRSRRARAQRYCEAAMGEGYLDLVSIFPSRMAQALGVQQREHWLHRWSDRFGSAIGKPDLAYGLYGRVNVGMDAPARIERLPRAARAIRHDMVFYLPEDLMRKSDTASMAAGLELRSPMLAKTLADAALSARMSDLMPRGERKGLLRAVARKYLPAEIVDRPKMGFAIPIGEWFRTDYGGLRTMLLDHLNSTEPFGPPSLGIDLNMAFIRQMLDEHLGTGPSGMVKRDHSQRLYMLLVLSIWAKWVGGLQGGR